MKISPSRLQLMALIGGLMILLPGGVAYWLMDGQIDDVHARITTANSEKLKLTGARYLPGPANINALTKNNESLSILLDGLQERLLSPQNQLPAVRQQNAVVFKQQLAEEIKKLADVAKKKNVALSPGLHFGFARYDKANPPDKVTLDLGKQLLAVREISLLLFQSGIGKLEIVRRTFDEDGNTNAVPPPSAGEATEALRGRSVTLAQGLYVVHPFEFEFIGSPVSLRTFLSGVVGSPYLFVVRSLHINSLRPAPQRLDDLARVAAPSTETEKKRPPIPAMGDEQIRVRARIDLIEWIGKTGATPEKK